MKRTLALVLAALLAAACFACKKEPGKPGEPGKSSIPLLTLYDGKGPMRVVTQQRGVKVTLQLLEYEPTVGFFRPIADEWEEDLVPGRTYELPSVPTAGMPEYRLLVQQGENIAVHLLTSGGEEEFEIAGGPWAPGPIDGDSPMVHLARTAAVVPKDDGDLYGYWYAVANAIATLRAVDLELEPDELVPREYDPDDPKGFYRIPEWLFEAYALALYPGMDVPPLGDYDLWVEYHPETHERYWVGAGAYADSARAEYKDAKQNSDGTWDVTFTVSYEYSDEIEEKAVRLAPNESYNPDSPFEYHIAGWPEFDYGGDDDDPPNPNIPPPWILVGTWRAPVKHGHAAWLEIHEDGMAGLYLGRDESVQLYEIYSGTVCPADDTDKAGVGVDYVMEMEFTLDWHIYESGDGTPVTGVPDAYQGIYTLRTEWEGNQQVLYVTANEGDLLYGNKELKMLWTQKTLGGGSMMDIESVG